jgi:hypothetical protein
LPLLGDYNQDGAVDGADYVTWRKTDGGQASYNNWRKNFGNNIGSGGAAEADSPVPEPAAALLLIIAAAIGCWKSTPEPGTCQNSLSVTHAK